MKTETNSSDRKIGPVIFRFEIHVAIERGILCELDYYPIEYVFSDVDKAAQQAAWKRHAAREKEGDCDRRLLYMELGQGQKTIQGKDSSVRRLRKEASRNTQTMHYLCRTGRLWRAPSRPADGTACRVPHLLWRR